MAQLRFVPNQTIFGVSEKRYSKWYILVMTFQKEKKTLKHHDWALIIANKKWRIAELDDMRFQIFGQWATPYIGDY